MKRALKTLGFWTAALLVWELTLRFTMGTLTPIGLWSVPFTLSLALFFTALSHIWPRRWANRLTRYVLAGCFALLYAVQTVYFVIFDSLLSLSFVGMGGEAIAGFIVPTLKGIWASAVQIPLILLPIPALAVLEKRGVLEGDSAGVKPCLLALGASVILFLLGVPWGDTGPRSTAYYDGNAPLENKAAYFGLFTAERLDVARLVSGGGQLSQDVIDITNSGDGTEEPERNILEELDFQKLSQAANDDTLRDLTRYFSGLAGTNKNEYTGFFRDFNLIQICAESYCPYVVDPERTPALYRLTHQGFVFENFYCSYSGLTTNGEYSLNMGLLPDMSRMSFAASSSNYLPFCLAKCFADAGVHPRAYHNFTGYYYRRVDTHANMGYDFKAIGNGLEIPEAYPYSDLDMMRATVDDYLGDDRFLAYYMTFSAHTPFDFSHNDMSAKNRDTVEGLDAPEDLKAYLAATMELEYALEYLLDRLEQAELLDKTVIVLTGDHYPYALEPESFALLAGDSSQEDPFWKYKNSFVCWSGAMEEPVYVDSFCCTQDILPTLLNLFDIPYDSRLLTGTDILSDSTHIAVLQDGSFRTEDLIYDSRTGTVTPAGEGESGEYAEKLIETVKNQFNVSASILRRDYYGFAFRTLGLTDWVPQREQEMPFIDCVGKWYADALARLAAQGVVNGGNGFTFRGEEQITRSAFAVMVVNALGMPEPEDLYDCPYEDLTPEMWQFRPMQIFRAAGFIESGDRCRPDAPLGAEEAQDLAEKLSVYLGFSETDGTVTELMARAMELAAENGYTGVGLSRGAAAYFVDGLEGLA